MQAKHPTVTQLNLDILEELVDNSLKCSVTTIPILSL